jgi:23S rRNA (adenine2030-N6)-methyltransferase
MLRLELQVRAWKDHAPIHGCGMLVVNPPWKFDAEARPLLDWLAKALAQDRLASGKVDWLAPE